MGRGGVVVNPSDFAGHQVFVSVALWGTGGWGGGERSSRGDRDVRMKQKNTEAFHFMFDLIKTWFDFLDFNPFFFYRSGLYSRKSASPSDCNHPSVGPRRRPPWRVCAPGPRGCDLDDGGRGPGVSRASLRTRANMLNAS